MVHYGKNSNKIYFYYEVNKKMIELYKTQILNEGRL
jgi:hypothetical protein